MEQSSLVVNAHPFLNASLQKSTEDFFTPILNDVRGRALVFRTNISETCGVIDTTARGSHEDTRRGNAK